MNLMVDQLRGTIKQLEERMERDAKEIDRLRKLLDRYYEQDNA